MDAIENNKAFFTGKPAWHNLGKVLQDAPSLSEAWKIAYPHELFKLKTQAIIESDDGTTHTMPLERCAIVRDDGKEIGSVNKSYELVQPWDAMSIFNPIIESGLVELESGGSLCEGTKFWALAKIKNSDTEIVRGDAVKAYVLMATGFDGSLGYIAKNVNERVVCANTLAIALGESAGICNFKFRHTKSIHEKIANATNEIMASLSSFKKDCEVYRSLVQKKMTDSQMKTFVRRVFISEEMDNGDDEVSTRTENKVQSVQDLIFNQRGLELVPAIQGTAWQAYNAVTQYLTHEHGRNDDTRLNGQWFGDSANVNRKALDMAIAY